MRTFFTVLPARPWTAEGWCSGDFGDATLMMECCAYLVPCPVVLVVMRLEGGAGGTRALFDWLADLETRAEVAGFATRTRSRQVERLFERFGGRVTFDEGDGDRRWWAPAAPGVAFLRRFRARGLRRGVGAGAGSR